MFPLKLFQHGFGLHGSSALMKGHQFPFSHQIQHLFSGSLFICNNTILVYIFLSDTPPLTGQVFTPLCCHCLFGCPCSSMGVFPKELSLLSCSQAFSPLAMNSKASIIFRKWAICPLKVPLKLWHWTSCQHLQLNMSVVFTDHLPCQASISLWAIQLC